MSTEDIMTRRLAELIMSASQAFPLPFEKAFNPTAMTDFAANHWNVCFGIVGVYMAFCYFGKRYMESRKPFDLRIPLAAWNAFLCIFSFIGMCRTVSCPLIFFFSPFLMFSLFLFPFSRLASFFNWYDLNSTI
jgi:hypothetical protein